MVIQKILFAYLFNIFLDERAIKFLFLLKENSDIFVFLMEFHSLTISLLSHFSSPVKHLWTHLTLVMKSQTEEDSTSYVMSSEYHFTRLWTGGCEEYKVFRASFGPGEIFFAL